MRGVLDLRVAMLLMARLCHDLAGPIGAFGNGVEMLADPEPGFAREAMRLAAGSAAEAASRLQFYRLAYGLGGADAAPAELARGFFAATTIACDYASSARQLPPAGQKLACNLLLVGAEGLPRGGSLLVTANARGLAVEAVGEAAALPAEHMAALTAAVPTTALTPRTVQAYFTGLLAGAEGLRLEAAAAGAGRLRIAALRDDDGRVADRDFFT